MTRLRPLNSPATPAGYAMGSWQWPIWARAEKRRPRPLARHIFLLGPAVTCLVFATLRCWGQRALIGDDVTDSVLGQR